MHALLVASLETWLRLHRGSGWRAPLPGSLQAIANVTTTPETYYRNKCRWSADGICGQGLHASLPHVQARRGVRTLLSSQEKSDTCQL